MKEEKKICKMQFRCTEEQRNQILKKVQESGATTQSEYFLQCCLYGSPNYFHKTMIGLLVELDGLLIKLQNSTLKKKKFIKQMKQEMDDVWSTLK